MARFLALIAGQFEPSFSLARSVKLLFLTNISPIDVRGSGCYQKFLMLQLLAGG